MDLTFATPDVTKIYADIEKQVLLKEIKKWVPSTRWDHERIFYSTFEISDKAKAKIARLFEHKIKLTSSFKSSIFDENLIAEIGQFHCPNSYAEEIPMTFYRTQTRNECQKEIIKAIIRKFLKEQIKGINGKIEHGVTNDKSPLSFCLCNFDKWSAFLNTRGLGNAKESIFHDMLCQELIRLYDLKKCDLKSLEERRLTQFTFYFK